MLQVEKDILTKEISYVHTLDTIVKVKEMRKMEATKKLTFFFFVQGIL